MTLTAIQICEALLGRGYFPKELPPPFQTTVFAEKSANLRPIWAAAVAAMPTRARNAHPNPSHPILYDMARKGHARRTLAIPNPINQFYLCETIATHWNSITNIINNSKLSITKCDIASEGRAVPISPLSKLAEKRILLYATKDAILQTDVLSFYHSIYTHAIPWALHGKAAAKVNRNSNDPNFFGNKIDALARSCQDGQTIGVPVGPDTSRIISELMLAAVELQIPQRMRQKISSGFRYIDDFFLCFETLSDAEMVLSSIKQSCLHFDLQLNSAKTNIVTALSFNEETWPNEIAAMPLERSGKGQRRSLLRFFSNVIRFSKNLPDESIANFAIKKTSKILITPENWDIYEAFILRIALENSNCIDSVTKILCTYAAIGYELSPSINDFIERIIFRHAPYNQHFEVSWALWLALSLNIRLSPASSDLLGSMANDICALLTLDLERKRLLSGKNKISSWINRVTKSDLYSDHWLLVYEDSLYRRNSVAGAVSAVTADSFFSAMKSEGVSFYNNRARNRALNIPGIKFKLQNALQGRKQAVLAGRIFSTKDSIGYGDSDDEYEELGSGDYDSDRWGSFRSYNEDDEDEE